MAAVSKLKGGSSHINIVVTLFKGKMKLKARAMIDSGATGIFIDETFCQNYKIPTVKRNRPIKLTLFNGTSAGDITRQVKADLLIGDNKQALVFEVTKLSNFPIVLGLPWLKEFNPTINWEEEEIVFAATDVALEDEIPKEFHEYLDVFSESEAKILPPHRPWDCKIDLIEGKLFKRGGIYDLSPAELKAQDEWITEHLEKGYIRPSQSPLSTSTFFVKKKDESGKMNNIRLVVDYRYLNSITVKNRYPIPLIRNLTDQLRSAKLFTKMDLRYGYHLVRIAKGDEWKTAFATRHGLFEYTVMPLGLCNAPAVFQQMMNEILFDLLDHGVVNYIDDILVATEDDDEKHTRLVLEVLRRLREHNLFVKPAKCKFKVRKVEFLGFIVSEDGLQMDPGKTDAVKDWPAPKSIPELQSFLGFCNFYRRFIPEFSNIARPLNNLLKKKIPWKWDTEQQAAFRVLKDKFETDQVLLHPDPEKQFWVECDASGYAIGGELSQIGDDGMRHPVAFYSKSMLPAERNYDIHDRELLAVVRCFQQWRHYLEGAKYQVMVRSDHKNLQIFRTTKVLTSRQVRWAEFLSRFNFVITYQSGKESARTDALSRRQDHKPDDRPELVDRIFTDEQFLAAIETAQEWDEAAVMTAIRSMIKDAEDVKPYITLMEETGKDVEDWSWVG